MNFLIVVVKEKAWGVVYVWSFSQGMEERAECISLKLVYQVMRSLVHSQAKEIPGSINRLRLWQGHIKGH